MWQSFKPEVHSVICAFNCSPFIESAIVAHMLADKPCDYQVARLKGMFRGNLENSFQIDKRAIDWSKFTNMMHRYEQDMILLVSNGLVYPLLREQNYYVDSMSKPWGRFVEVPEEHATDDYTLCLETGKFYVIEAM